MKTLSEVWKNSATLGIFSRLEDDYNVPWISEAINTNFLNLQYHFNRSGQKIISPLVESLLVDGELAEQGQKTVAGVCWQMFHIQWAKLFETLEYQYNAINNYDMTETGTDTTNGTHSNTTNSTDDGEDVTQFNENNTNSLNNGVYAFNSQTAVPSDTSSGSDNNTSTTTTIYGKENTTTDNGSDSNTVQHTLTRSGNIGVMSTQDLIKQQREVVDYSYFEKIMQDIDTVLCLEIY